MLKHTYSIAQRPTRVVVLGETGFVAHASIQRLRTAQIEVLPLARHTLDLTMPDAATRLAQQLQGSDTLLVIAAQAPCKDNTMLLNNILIMQHICQALQRQPVRHVIYISSDAVYADSAAPLTESSWTAPTALHGVMHLAREMMLQSIIGTIPLVCLRPSLLYGADDPHNGYGPNQFRRLHAQGKPIILFGQGEEQRDHVFIADVAELIYLCAIHQSAGVLNIASGEVITFRQIAEFINSMTESPVAIQSRPRHGPMPHNGYRAFDNNACYNAFPQFRFTTIKNGLKMVCQQQLKELTQL